MDRDKRRGSNSMKKIILAIALVTSAFAGVVGNTSVSYGNVDATAKALGIEVSASTKTTSIRQDFGYEFSHTRVLGYVQLDKYKDEMVAGTEDDAVSYGVEVDYIHAVNDRFGFFVGGLIGKGEKDLGSDGDSVGISKLTFTDMAVRTGVSYLVGSWNLEAGVENKVRDYDSETVSGVRIELEEKIQSIFVSAGYKF